MDIVKAVPYPTLLPILKPEWLTSTVVSLAKGIHETGDWSRLPILADALQDAECDDECVLHHLRGTFISHAGKMHGTYYVACTDVGHRDGKFPNLNGGCWLGTCWVIRWLLKKPQKVVATIRPNEAGFVELYAINPGGRDGMCWLVAAQMHAFSPTFVVESDNPQSATDEFVESPFGKDVRIADEDMGDYVRKPTLPETQSDCNCSFTDNGTPYDSESISLLHLLPQGQCRYHGPNIPYGGVTVKAYAEKVDCMVCQRPAYPKMNRGNRPWHTTCSAECWQSAMTETLKHIKQGDEK